MRRCHNRRRGPPSRPAVAINSCMAFQQLRRELRPSRSGRVRYHAFLREGRWYEYVIHFALGGAAAVLTGLISSGFGASVGGLFLALPAIFCASARPLSEKHEIRPKREL